MAQPHDALFKAVLDDASVPVRRLSTGLADRLVCPENLAVTLPKIDIECLSKDERLTLIEQIWDSLSHEDVGLTEPQLHELAQRIDDVECRPEDVVSWPEAQRRIRERKR